MLVCSLENTPYCYIGYADGVLYCNRVYIPIDFANLDMYVDVKDLATYASIIPINFTIHCQIYNNPIFKKWLPHKPRWHPMDINTVPDWKTYSGIDKNEIMFLLLNKMAYYTIDKIGDIVIFRWYSNYGTDYDDMIQKN